MDRIGTMNPLAILLIVTLLMTSCSSVPPHSVKPALRHIIVAEGCNWIGGMRKPLNTDEYRCEKYDLLIDAFIYENSNSLTPLYFGWGPTTIIMSNCDSTSPPAECDAGYVMEHL